MEVVASFDKCFGAKIVRGAYMDKERRLARELGYEDPVNESYEATAGMYNRVVDFMMEAISRSLARDRVNIVVATHNEAGALHAASKMLSLGIPPDSGHVVFGQVSSNTGTDILLQKKQKNVRVFCPRFTEWPNRSRSRWPRPGSRCTSPCRTGR